MDGRQVGKVTLADSMDLMVPVFLCSQGSNDLDAAIIMYGS